MNTLQQGTVLHGSANTYTIEKELGQGSFGITYLANTKVKVQGPLGMLETEMKVAIKEFFMKDLNGREGTRVTSFSSGGKEGLCEKYKAKFIKESQNLSKLQHPGIVKVLESFEANGTAYYVMEYCEGGSLEERIKSHGGLGEGEAKSLACKIGDALSYMHSRGMLHLDLKPGNIMLRADGTPVVIDFGLSKQYTSDGKAESSTTVGLGTPGYAPIEQGDYQESKGKFPVTMDVYAFGATVFKMLTGNTPPKASEVMNHGFPAYELQDKNVSITTIRAIKKAMADRVVDRCQSVKEFVTLLGEEPNTIIEPDDTIHETPKPKPPTPPTPPKPTPTPPAPKPNYLKYILGVLAVALGVVIGVVLTNNDSASEPVVEEEPVVAEEPFVDTTAVVEPGTTQREEQERLAEEQRKREQAEADRKQHEEQERIAEEQRKQEEAARKQREEQERLAEEQRKREQAEADRKQREEQERIAEEQRKREQEKYNRTHGTIRGHDWVDLGLSVKWATCNVGASQPHGYGNCYAWGETTTKSEYTDKNSRTYGKNISDIRGNSTYDVARSNWEGSWRLPTKREMEELKNRCTWTWTSQSGVKGYKVTGPNGNSIFLPAAGYCRGSSRFNVGEYGRYWSSSPDNIYQAYYLGFGSGGRSVDWGIRRNGYTVRPVSE